MRLLNYLQCIDDARRSSVIQIYHAYEQCFHSNPGSTFIHQNWKGGLADHLADMYRICLHEYKFLSEFVASRNEKLPFTLGSAQIAIFAHDAEKVIVYADPQSVHYQEFIKTDRDATEKAFKEDLKWDVLRVWKERYGFVLTDAEINAVKYTHGEGSDYRNDRRVMNELAAFVGNIDRTSARILYNSGRGLG